MATQKVLYKYGQQLLFANHGGDFGSGPATAPSLIIGSPTDVEMNLSVLANTAMWQSAKTGSLADTGSSWPLGWIFGACMESDAPTAGFTFDFFWNASANATAASGNSGGCSGSDATYTAAGTSQLIPLGSLFLRAVTINVASDVRPGQSLIQLPHLYGSLVIVNNSGQNMVDTTADNIHFTLTPLIPDIQAAA